MPDMDSVWSDDDYHRALAHLDALQQQLNDVRISIPKTIAVLPTLTSPSDPSNQSPNVVFKNFAANAVNTAHQVSNIRENWKSQATTQILDKVRDSVARDGDVHVQNMAHKSVDSPFNVKVEEMTLQQDEVPISAEGIPKEEDEDSIVEGVRQAYQHLGEFEIIRPTQRDLLKVTIPVHGILESYRFTCERYVQGQNDWWYRTTCIYGPSAENHRDSITRCLEERPNKQDLLSTLHMLAAYHSDPMAACAKCKRKTEVGTGLRPSARRRIHLNNDPSSGWQPFHEACLK